LERSPEAGVTLYRQVAIGPELSGFKLWLGLKVLRFAGRLLGCRIEAVQGWYLS